MFRQVIEFIFSVVVALAAFGGVIAFFANWFGNFWATRIAQKAKAELDKEIESHKFRLKKSDFIFQKEYEAASELSALFRGILPNHPYPDMDWYEACDHMALNFDDTEKKFSDFLMRHGAILPDAVTNLISSVTAISGNEKHRVSPLNIPSQANEYANEIYKKLREADVLMRNKIFEQTDT